MLDYRANVPSLISASRVVIVLPIWYCVLHDFSGSREIAFAFIVLAVATDFLDGYLARRLHRVTELGKIIDPLADKIAVTVVAVALLLRGELEWWFVLAVLFRDVLIVLGGMYIRRKKKIIVQSNWPGKFAVSFIALTLALTILRIPPLTALRSVALWLSLILMAVSFGLYVQRLFIGRTKMKP